jgi:succinyl-CoA synthetase beta subunit
MKIHEYQAKEILRKYGVSVPDGETVTTLEEAETAAKTLFSAGSKVVVVKAQIHAGGRGKGGGVKVVKSLEDAVAASKAILGMQLVTHQTGPQGQKVRQLLIEQGSSMELCVEMSGCRVGFSAM